MFHISPLAFVHPNAKIGDNVTINAFAYIDDNVEIGDGCVIGPHVSIRAGARIGKNNKFFDGCVISATPQDFRWKGDDSYVLIGDNNTIREHVIINRSIYAGKATKIGSNSFIMAQSHIAHDSIIGDYVVLGNAVKIAGACKIGNYTILSSNALVHENCDVAEWVLIKGGCRVNNNVPPYTIMAHNPIEYFGINAYILRKAKFSEDMIDEIAKSYRHVYQSQTSPFNAIKRIKSDVADSDSKNAIIDFIVGHNYKLAGLPREFSEID